MKRLKNDGTFDDHAIGAEAAEVAVRAANRVIQVLSYIGGRQGQLPLLSLFDLRGFLCEDLSATPPRSVDVGGLLTERAIRLREPSQSQASDVQERLNQPHAAFEEAETLWLDSLEAFYAGRLREAVVILRAAIEVAWRAAFDRAIEAFSRCPVSPVPAGILAAYAGQGTDKRTSLVTRLTEYSKVVLGFSFKDDWEADQTTKWDKLNSFFQTRHEVAHGSGQPSSSNVWDGLTLTREVLSKLTALSDAVVAQCPA